MQQFCTDDDDENHKDGDSDDNDQDEDKSKLFFLGLELSTQERGSSGVLCRVPPPPTIKVMNSNNGALK